MLKRISPEELDKAFDGDFGEVSFDHKPTAEDIFLIKLGLVAQAQLEADRKAILDNQYGGVLYLKDGYCLVTLYITPEEYQQLRENK